MFRNILVAVHDSPAAQQALREAIGLAERGGGRLTILTAVPRPPAWISTPMTAAACEPLAREFERDATRALRAARDLVPADVPLTTILTHKPLRQALLTRLDCHPHDLLVLGCGRLARRLERRGPVPVLAVPAPQRAEDRPAAAGPAAPRPDRPPGVPLAGHLRLPG